MLTIYWPFSEDPQPWRQAHSGSNVLTINWPFSEIPWPRRQHTNSPKHSSCYVLCVQFCSCPSYFSSSLIWYHYSQNCWALSKKAKRLKSNLGDASVDPGELASLTTVLLISLPFLGILSLSSNKPGVSAQLLFFHFYRYRCRWVIIEIAFTALPPAKVFLSLSTNPVLLVVSNRVGK